MSYKIILTQGAKDDIEDIYTYIAQNDGQLRANGIVEQLLETISTLKNMPNKGSIPKELQEIGIADYRQTLFKIYRIIYEIQESEIIIMLIADGRRDMKALLAKKIFNI